MNTATITVFDKTELATKKFMFSFTIPVPGEGTLLDFYSFATSGFDMANLSQPANNWHASMRQAYLGLLSAYVLKGIPEVYLDLPSDV